VSTHRVLFATVCLAACASSGREPDPQAARPAPAPALAVTPLAGQKIPVLPVSYLTAEAPVDEGLPVDRTARLHWADSLLGDALLARGPEIDWVLAPELRRVAARAPNTVVDPDRMGQSILRAQQLERTPDPLRAYLRALAAITNARMVMVPAAIRFERDPATGTVRAELVLVLVDTRNGAVAWRSHPSATGDSPAAALRATIARVFPDFN
jgi:hypothetical protein